MPIMRDELLPGATYFILMYADECLAIPLVQTLVYREQRIREDGSLEFIFREIRPHDHETVFSVRVDDIESLVLDQPELIYQLQNPGGRPLMRNRGTAG